MITKNDFTAAEQSVPAKHSNIQSAQSAVTKEHSRRRSLWKLGGAASVAALAVGLIGSGAAPDQVNALEIIPLAQGSSSENNLNLHVKGPSDVLQSLLVFQPGGDPVVLTAIFSAIALYYKSKGWL
jgi:hypothetical protein